MVELHLYAAAAPRDRLGTDELQLYAAAAPRDSSGAVELQLMQLLLLETGQE